MKKTLFRTLFAIACTAVAATSCYKDDTGKGADAIYGQWVLDTQTITIEASVSGNGSKNQTVVDFTDSNCILELGTEGASARLGTDMAVTLFSYDASSKRIDFPRGLSVSGGGKVFALAGSYDVTELTGTRLVLSQKDIGVSIGSFFDATQTAVFVFHRKEDAAQREEKSY